MTIREGACLICSEDSKYLVYWMRYMAEKGFRTEIKNGYLVRIFTAQEWAQYLRDIKSIPRVAI